MAEKNCELLKGFGSCHSWKLQQPTEPRSISRHENQKYHPHTRLQNSPYFCVFKYATREQSNKRSGTKLKTESETWGESRLTSPTGTLRACEARALRARKTLTARFTDFFTDFEKKNDCFAVYPHTH